MSALGYMTTTETIVGWRCWRILPFRRLDGSATYRLCAVGTLGVPKVWQPQEATEAVCSKYASQHESPWADCECGIWALERSESARRRMVVYMQTQGGEIAGWAWGEVSLWGRVIEHELGWRGQHAYPYAITVESPDEQVAQSLRSEYAIDVEWAGGELYAKALTKARASREAEKSERARRDAERRAASKRLDAIIDKLGKPREVAKHEPPWKVEKRAWLEEVTTAPPIPALDGLSVDEVLSAFVVSVVGREEARPTRRGRFSSGPHSWHVRDIVDVLVYARGTKGRLRWGEDVRPGYKEAERVVRAMMREARTQGLLEQGLPYAARHSHSSGGYWYITRSGLARVAKLSPRSVLYQSNWGEKVALEVDLARAVRILRRHPRPLFVEEVEALLPTWMAERRAAKRRGMKVYAAFLADIRAAGKPEMLQFTDEEVEAAVRKQAHPVLQVDVMEELAPGERLHGEISRFSAQLVRLHKQGQLRRRKQGNRNLWEVAHAR